ncbi:UDP-4-amino-4, 6-dideoxy-N-acetyl-beta-L-altrosamine N-acetyltransferase [Alteromonas sp. 38]|uniref:UDP-4-amino-4, 6-dideoxy-N-acetyl-beta-L-altrosamine N-acetyltransferase n=1 Tax=Alteromonas TaxID=226 RepID=UPI0012F2622B|nr:MULTISPECIES: UDP-4-amino-4,6-dideoxy-N-acetyl-beta-L-altrosamine N-acetyltransferase [Alteromonas]CAD5285897.1 UDP-4-amino-4, 6-dideoxy-N-acetyl-beta-L-altrosamine N-acetyltransferase [Alteromonas sp. 154]VXB35718.1 UDP-4-amino-4, 6-dideoxy-N-acetyl-beta-L-altrosamine N-acetyltransferase [Alteromonas sp. 38]
MFKFRHITPDDLAIILKWRTSDDVNKFMLSDVSYDLEQQKKWFQAIQSDRKSGYWIIEYNHQSIGVLNQSEISVEHKRCSWGFYIGDPNLKQLGGLIPPYFYNYVFASENINKITAEVLSNNEKVMKLHRLHAYRDVGVYQSHIYKNDEWYDLHLFELHKEDWLQKKRFSSFLADFE